MTYFSKSKVGGAEEKKDKSKWDFFHDSGLYKVWNKIKCEEERNNKSEDGEKNLGYSHVS